MFYVIRFLLFLAFAGSLVVPAFSQDQPGQVLKGWGQVIDPDGDCRIGLVEGKATISIPGTKHDLSVESGKMNCPRVLRNIRGDFIAQVKVLGNVRHAGNRTSDQYLAYHGGGLLLWQDGNTYLRLERAAIVDQHGSPVHYANFELRKNGKRAETEKSSVMIPDKNTYVRLERRGGNVFGSVSHDGIHWYSYDPIKVELNKDLKLGIIAVNTSTEPFKVEFAEWELFRKEATK